MSDTIDTTNPEDLKDLKNVKYVDIYKKDKNGNILVTKTMTDKDFENINKMGVKIKEVDQNLQTLSDVQDARNNAQDEALNNVKNSINNNINNINLKNEFEIEQLRSQQSALKTRVEEVFNNGIDEIQQKRIEALERVDLDELAAIDKAAQDIDELRANGLTNMAELQAKDVELEGAISNLNSKVDTNAENTANEFNKVQDDIEALKQSVNSDIAEELNNLNVSIAAKNSEQDLKVESLQEDVNRKLISIDDAIELPENANEYEVYFVESKDHIEF